ncbi:hypothetical protein CA54_39730 [Symmachiella macrocystis]|uniref:Uncharacterized protein n=1 Tax=Symmachiella macrocystis TaxID=2527985 RepID=A0A5C6BBT4_9PLAN|nr:hypothetical protein CA54_39730 [Symmachiella macrocystis]
MSFTPEGAVISSFWLSDVLGNLMGTEFIG